MNKEFKEKLIIDTASRILAGLVVQDYSNVRKEVNATYRKKDIERWAGLADKVLCEAALGKAYELARQLEEDIDEGLIELE